MCRTFIRQNNACISILMVACIVKQMPAIIVTQFRFLCTFETERWSDSICTDFYDESYFIDCFKTANFHSNNPKKIFFGKMKRWNSWHLRYTEINLLFNTLPCFIEKEKLKFRNNPLIVCIFTSIEFVAEHC